MILPGRLEKPPITLTRFPYEIRSNLYRTLKQLFIPSTGSEEFRLSASAGMRGFSSFEQPELGLF